MDRPEKYSSSSDPWKAAACITLGISFFVIPLSKVVWSSDVGAAEADGELLAYVCIGAFFCWGLLRRAGHAAVPKALFALGLVASTWAGAYAWRAHQDMIVLKHAVDAFAGVEKQLAPARVKADPPLYVPGYRNETRQVASVLYDMADITYAGKTNMDAIGDQVTLLSKQLDMKPQDVFFNRAVIEANRHLTSQIDSQVSTQVGVFQLTEQNLHHRMDGADVPQSMKKGYLSSAGQPSARMEDALKNLTQQELVLTSSVNGYLNFAEREIGKVKMQDGKILFMSRPELDEFNTRKATLRSSGEGLKAAAAAVTELRTATMSGLTALQKMVGE